MSTAAGGMIQRCPGAGSRGSGPGDGSAAAANPGGQNPPRGVAYTGSRILEHVAYTMWFVATHSVLIEAGTPAPKWRKTYLSKGKHAPKFTQRRSPGLRAPPLSVGSCGRIATAYAPTAHSAVSKPLRKPVAPFSDLRRSLSRVGYPKRFLRARRRVRHPYSRQQFCPPSRADSRLKSSRRRRFPHWVGERVFGEAKKGRGAQCSFTAFPQPASIKKSLTVYKRSLYENLSLAAWT